MLSTLASGTTFAVMFIFISSSAIIYLQNYITGSLLYCLYYAFCVVASIAANMIIKKLSHKIKDLKYTYYGIAILLISCLILAVLNALNLDNAIIYTVVMFVLCGMISFVCTILYSFSINQVSHSFGTANAISNFLKNMIAGSGSFIVSYFYGRGLIVYSAWVQIGFIICTILLVSAIYKLKIESHLDN